MVINVQCGWYPDTCFGHAGLDAGGHVNTTALVVPSIIHQTWKTEVIPEKWVAARQSCMDLHPGYEFRLWTDESARELIATELPELLRTYDSYVYGIERADAIRCALPCITPFCALLGV